MTNDQRIGILPIQLAVATASPGAWRDAIVVGATPEGLRLMSLDGDVVEVSTGASVATGSPVALHPVAELLALGTERFRARRIL